MLQNNSKGFESWSLALLLILGLAAMGLAGCQMAGGGGSNESATITNVGWDIENCPSDMTSNILCYNFYLYYSGNISASSVQYARVYLSDGTYWTIDPAIYLNATRNYIGGIERCYWNTSVTDLPVYALKAEIKLNNGKDSTYSFTPHIPGSLTNGSYSYVYAPEAGTGYYSGEAAAVARPVATGIIVSSNVTVTFTTNDTHVNNGWVWFYDSGDNYLGGFFYFRDSTTGATSSRLNGGSPINKNGTQNTVTVSASDIKDTNGNPLSSVSGIAHCRVVVTDGSQYEIEGTGHYADYDYESISAMD